MIDHFVYLARADGQIAVCETKRTTQKKIAQGFVPCSPALHRAYWWRKDRRALAAMAGEQERARVLVERAVGMPGIWD